MRVPKRMVAELGFFLLAWAAIPGCGSGGQRREAGAARAQSDAVEQGNPIAGQYDFAVIDALSGDASDGAVPGLQNPSGSCVREQDGSVRIERTWIVDAGISATELRRSKRVDLWRGGAWFGRNDAQKPNVGFRDKLGRVVNGAPLSGQPGTLGCKGPHALVLGWQFSNNVAGLMNLMQLDTLIVRGTGSFGRPGTRTEIRVSGIRTETYLDPASVEPVAGSPSQPYFDEGSAEGNGRMTISRVVQIGGEEANEVRIERQSGSARSKLFQAKVRTVAGAPLVERLTRDLGSGWSLRERLLLSGTFSASFEDGSTALSSVENLLYRKNQETGQTCVPVQGKLRHEFRMGKTADAPLVKVAQGYSADAAGRSLSETQISCPQITNPKRCAALAQRAMALYAPPACLY